LHLLEDDCDTSTSDKAKLQGDVFDFIVFDVIVKFVPGAMTTISEKLQKTTNDLLSVYELIPD